MTTIFLPMLIHFGMTITILIMLVLRRAGELRAEPNLLEKIDLDSSHYSDEAKKLSNNFQNQFQLPVFFHVGGILALLFSVTGWAAGALAWGFVISRIAHTVVHTTFNNVRVRFAFFVIGILCLIGLWVTIAMGAEESIWFRAAGWTIVETPTPAPDSPPSPEIMP